MLLFFCACAPAYGESKPSLKIGAVFSVTGRSSAIGVANKNTLLLVPEQVNRTGGIDGFPLEVLMEDDQTLESAAKAVVQKLIDTAKALAVVCPCTSGNSLAVKAICESAKIQMILATLR